MTADRKSSTPGVVPRKIKGFRDIGPELNGRRWQLVEAVSAVYRRYGFEHWDTPALEYADCLGKYLPDSDTIEEGVYSFRNPEPEPLLDAEGRELRDELNNVLMERQFLALRYDLTAPLARKYAEGLWSTRSSGATPPLFRRYQFGPVYRFEAKLDPGRFREFWQLDFDTVGVADVTCDAEACCILADALEEIGLERGTFEVRVNNRKLHQGLFERAGIAGDETLCREVIRVVDKLDKIGAAGVADELGKGRKDPLSGAFNEGLDLGAGIASLVVDYVESCLGVVEREEVLARLEPMVGGTPAGRQGLDELAIIHAALSAQGYGPDRVVFDPSVARGLAYYTGPVFEAVSKLEVRDESGAIRRFGSICGGGRYDGLVERLLGIRVPATGASIGVDRLVDLMSRVRPTSRAPAPVLVVTMDRSLGHEYQAIAGELRAAGIDTEVYYGLQGRLKAQLAYADQKGCPVAVIAGSDEIAKGTVSIKNLHLGKSLSSSIQDRSRWLGAQPAQVEVSRGDMAATVRKMLENASQ
jgi:histidyl-tRNA synthetase